MVSKIVIALCVLVAVAAAVPAAQPGGWGPPGAGGWGGPGAGGWGGPVAWGGPGVAGGVGGANPFLPPWLANAPWMPQWTPCTTIGTTCNDCTTKAVCTKRGQILSACTGPTPYCNLGACSATPSDACAEPIVPL